MEVAARYGEPPRSQEATGGLLGRATVGAVQREEVELEPPAGCVPAIHARGVGGSHVVIRWRAPGTPENENTITAAAALAAWYSAARESGGVEVDIAPRRHIRKIKGAGPGMVTYRNERTIRVKPAPEDQLQNDLRESWR